MRLVYARGDGETSTRNVPTPRAARERFCLADAEVLALADYAIRIEDHCSQLAGHPSPMDIVWAKDGEDGKLYIVQARPETVASQRAPDAFETYTLKATGRVLATGHAVGEKIASGKVRLVATPRDLEAFRPGEVLIATSWCLPKKCNTTVTAHGKHEQCIFYHPGSRVLRGYVYFDNGIVTAIQY